MMRDRVARLRVGMVVGTSLVVLAVAAFLGYAHYRSRAFLKNLPGRLGAEITRETNGYTYSQTMQGRTVFTLHAAKMEQRKDGVVRLHDVGVVLYGRKQDRADRIYGTEFEYDQAKGVVRALGEVHMDLQAPAPAEAGGKKQKAVSVTGGELATGDPRVIHILTSGLVYLTNLGVAATKEDLEFSEGMLTGRAHGADYSADTGVITLQSAVRVNGLIGSGPMVMTAGRAELNQTAQTVNLDGAKLVTIGETMEASTAVVHVRKDGSPERIEGSGRVAISRPGGGVVMASQGDAQMSAAGKAEAVRLWGGVRYVGEDEDGRRTQGAAAEARVRFDRAGEAVGVTATGNASLEQHGSAGSRVLTARVVEATLGPGGARGKRAVQDAEAVGGARLVVATEAGARTEMAGDDLKARFVGGRQVSGVVGTGHTVLRQVKSGVDEKSAGERTELVFRTAKGGDEELVSAVQAGRVEMVRKGLRKQGAAMVSVEEKGTADRAFYEGDEDRVTLSGGVVLRDAESTLWAEKVVAMRGTGDATAEGSVRMSYGSTAEAGGKEKEPVHVLANRAELRGEGSRRALFYGTTGRMARMWQGTSQVEAPVIELEDGARRLTASGLGEAMQVHTTLVSAGEAKAGAKREARASVLRIVSREMVYTDQAREAIFSGGVVVEDADGRMKGQKATVILQSGKAEGPKGGGEMFSGGTVDRVVTVGGVQIDQPGRRGTGEQLVYTSIDGMFVLTGTAAVPPRVVDEAKGTVTGGALRFHSGDDSVVATSEGIQSASGTKRRTETKVRQ